MSIALSSPPLGTAQFGLTESVAGQGFIIQPNGDALLWVMAGDLSPGPILVSTDLEQLTVGGDADVVTGANRNRLVAQTGVNQVWLRDPITRPTSNVVQFGIRDR